MKNEIEFYKGKLKIGAANLDAKNISIYKSLKAYDLNKEKDIFERQYKSYYGMNSAGLSEDLKTKYFSYINGQETIANYNEKFKKIVLELYEIPRIKGDHSLQISFVSKLLSFIDDRYPIYDRHVANLFGLASPYYGDLDFKIDVSILNINRIKTTYEKLAQEAEVIEMISKTKNEMEIDCSNTRIIDFYVWAFGNQNNN